jgi:hypothetical protein
MAGKPRRAKPYNAKPKSQQKPWEPTATQQEWYRKWVIEGWGPLQIAQNENPPVHAQNVCTMLWKIDKWMRAMTQDQLASYRHRQVQQCEMVMAEALASWRKSHGKIIKITTMDNDNGISTKETVEMSHGNPAYLMVYLAAQKAIANILGLEAAKQSEMKILHAEEIEGLPGMQGYANRSEALLAQADAIRTLALTYQPTEDEAIRTLD